MSRAKQEKGEIESAKLGLRARPGAELTQNLDVFNWKKIQLLGKRMTMRFAPKTELLLSLYCWVFVGTNPMRKHPLVMAGGTSILTLQPTQIAPTPTHFMLRTWENNQIPSPCGQYYFVFCEQGTFEPTKPHQGQI